ncbi:MAG: bifunctional enoyl-CoA hydratase/phosphate acetyltransferase [Spirochaetales bacterium]|nr:bifunctional enoyl-CoA hydratase/phosphate acetyltransferase [Spirochaetales bacterium]
MSECIDPKQSEDIWKNRSLIKNFDDLEEAIKDFSLHKVAVAAAQDAAVLEAVVEAKNKKIADYQLVGDREQILKIAEQKKLDIDRKAIEHEPDAVMAAKKAVQLVKDGHSDILMKGYIHSDDFLREVLNKDYGLRAQSLMSHVFIWEAKDYGRLIFVTDGGMNIAPDLVMKANIIMNSVHLARIFGMDKPKVAVLAAVEMVNPAMPASVDATCLAKMCDRHQYSIPCIIDGPLALDNALSERAAKHKKITSEVAGHADILVVPDIEAGNMLAKSFVYLAKGDIAGVIVGARAPVVLTSRADSARSKLYSIASAVLMSAFERHVCLKIGRVHY